MKLYNRILQDTNLNSFYYPANFSKIEIVNDITPLTKTIVESSVYKSKAYSTYEFYKPFSNLISFSHIKKE